MQPGQTPQAAEQALIAEFEKLKTRAGDRQRAAARQEPVRARLHRRPRVEPGQGAAPGARGRDPQRHHHRRRRVRHLHERHARPTCSAWPRPTSTSNNRVVLHILPESGEARDEARVAESGLEVRWALGCWALGVVLCASHAPNAQIRNWPSERPPRPLAAARSQVPALRDPHAAERHAGHRRPAPRAAGGHACGCWSRAGAAQDPAGQGAASPSLVGASARPGHDDAQRAADRRPDRLHRRRARHRLRLRPDASSTSS